MNFLSRVSSVLALLVLTVGLNCQATFSQTAPEIARAATDATVLLGMEDAAGQPLAQGSGFFVSETEVATNLHVVEGAAGGYAKLVGKKARYEIAGVTAFNAQNDLVILKITEVRGTPLKLAGAELPRIGETVFAVGNPLGLEGTFSQGIVSGVREKDGRRLLQITAPISPGSSGGPVLNDRGEVIGVSVSTFKNGQNLNFAIPVESVSRLLAAGGAAKPLSELKPKKVSSSILNDQGGATREAVSASAFEWGDEFGISGDFTVSLRNSLREHIQNVVVLAVFSDDSGQPLDSALLKCDIIPAGAAIRVTGSVDGSVQRLTTSTFRTDYGSEKYKRTTRTKVEYRVLRFDLTE